MNRDNTIGELLDELENKYDELTRTVLSQDARSYKSYYLAHHKTIASIGLLWASIDEYIKLPDIDL